MPEQIKQTFEKLGIPEAERKFLSGVGAQYDSEVVYHSVREELTKIGVVFMGTDQALKEYPEGFRKHFGTVVPPEDNKFSALNSAVWSAGELRLRAQGRRRAPPAAGLLPHQRREHGPVRVHAHRRRRGRQRSLHRGLLLRGPELVSLGEFRWYRSRTSFAGHQCHEQLRYRGQGVGHTPPNLLRARCSSTCPSRSVMRSRSRRSIRCWCSPPPAGRRLERVDMGHGGGRSPHVRAGVDPAAGKLQVGDLLSFPVAVKQRRPPPSFRIDFLRFLGYYLAEGSAFENGVNGVPTVRLSFHIDETAHDSMTPGPSDEPADRGSAPACTRSRPSTRPRSTSTRATSYGALLEVLRHPVHRRKRLHADIMELPPARQMLLLETYLTGDGNRHTRAPQAGRMVRAMTTSQTLAYQLQEIIGSATAATQESTTSAASPNR